ncbi:MAG: MOSC domain-containing protein [Gemmatimonadaceae bacterium]|nr:MOSC domain-containing protein [Gemmatimonadaceae bacterium]
MSGTLIAIWKKRSHRGPMDAVESATLVTDAGLEGSVDRSRRRQVTLVDAERWARAVALLPEPVDPIARRANLLVSGVVLAETRGRLLRIGSTLLQIGGETTPCERMEEAAAGLQEALRDDWGGGAFAQVIEGGDIAVGDSVDWVEPKTGAA